MNQAEDDFEALMNNIEVKNMMERASREMLPKMKASRMSLIIAGTPDIKLCLEVGAAVLFDKPLLVVIQKGQRVGANPLKLAAEVVEADIASTEGKEAMHAAINRILDRLPKERS